MDTTRRAEPSLMGIPVELRLQIYGFVAADTEKRVVLGRKLLEASKNGDHDGDIHEQFCSTIMQHPLSMTCRRIQAEFLSGPHKIFSQTRSQTYDLVVNNFDYEQMEVFEVFVDSLEQARQLKNKGGWLSRGAQATVLKFSWLMESSMELRFQLDHNIRTSAAALDVWFAKHLRGVKGGRCSEISLALRNDFTILTTYRDWWSQTTMTPMSMTAAQGIEAKNILSKYYQQRRGLCGGYCDVHCFGKLLPTVLRRFASILDARRYRETG